MGSNNLAGDSNNLSLLNKVKALENELMTLKQNEMIYRRSINSDEDLNDILQAGYYAISSAASETVSNLGFLSASVLEVIVSGYYIIQIQHGVNKTMQRFRNASGVFYNWY